MNEQDLLALKKELDESKENLSKLEGRKEVLLEQLQKEFGVKTIAAAERRMQKLEADIEDYESRILAATKELEDELNDKNSSTEE